MKTITFELTTPIKYAMNGGEVEANHIDLCEPTGRVSHLCCEIESLIQSGIMKMADLFDSEAIENAKEDKKNDKKTDDDAGMDEEAIMSIMSGGDIDMKKIVINFRELFKEVALMGGEKPLTIPRMNDMSHKDFKKMIGVYTANFILS